MGCEGEGIHQSGSGWSPVFVEVRHVFKAKRFFNCGRYETFILIVIGCLSVCKYVCLSEDLDLARPIWFSLTMIPQPHPHQQKS